MPLDIIGPGFGRTGTATMKAVLDELGFGPCHHMHEVIANPEQLPAWAAAARGEAVDWSAVFSGYRSQMDWPGARYWRELTDAFPDAKVILTVRPPAAWYESADATVFDFVRNRSNLPDPHLRAIGEMAVEGLMGPHFDNRQDDREHAIAVFERHIEEVRAQIAAERLLVYDVAEGWEPLCGFLGVPVPAKPFPHINPRQEFRDDKGLDAAEAPEPA